MRYSRPAALFPVVLLSLAASGAELSLKPDLRAGDSYILSLNATTRTSAESRGPSERSFEEDVALDYHATVRVLEVDAQGRPVRERHAGVKLGVRRGEGPGSLFAEGTALEIHRDRNAGTRVYLDGQRVERSIEEIVLDILDRQFEYTSGPALLEPGRAVEIGESWELDPELAQRFVSEHGVGVHTLGEHPRAVLERHTGRSGEDELVIRYRIPIERLRSEALPTNVRSSGSRAIFSGEVRVRPDRPGDPASHASLLSVSMRGAVVASGVARSFPWELRRARLWDQRAIRVAGSSAAGAGGVASAPSRP